MAQDCLEPYKTASDWLERYKAAFDWLEPYKTGFNCRLPSEQRNVYRNRKKDIILSIHIMFNAILRETGVTLRGC